MCTVIAACDKVKIDTPDDFTIAVETATVRADSNIVFTMSGNPDDIVFYSGELNKNYDLRDVSVKETSGKPEFEFTSNLQYGTVGLNNLSILASTDFSGQYDAANVARATWTDITTRAVLGTSATNVSSGIINLNDLKTADKPIYIAFRYVSERASTVKQRQWTIAGFQFRTKFDDGKVYTNAAALSDVGFASIDVKGDSAQWASASSLIHVGLNEGRPEDDDWVISKGFDLKKINADNKGAVNIKAIYQPKMTSYTYAYATPGVYKATFIATNQKNGEQKQTVRRVEITVTE